jgi:murein DD-endopeptidase MepM/ murein hydrolase activator NlpD
MMPDRYESNSYPFIPRRLFTNRLQSGFHELSVHFIFSALNLGSIRSLEWEIESEDDDICIRSKARKLSPEEERQGAVLITATLPLNWDHGRLKVLVDAGKGPRPFELPIERFSHEVEFYLPLKGQALTVVGHRIGEAHRSAYQIPSQQFGWDFLGLSEENLGIFRVSPSGRLHASDFAGFGKEVIAPADGQVMGVRDGVDDLEEIGQLPQDLSYFQKDLTRAGGNTIILRHSEDIWSVLAHFKRDSVVARAGQNVSAGEVLGTMGNSGFSSGPHLHFHLMDGPKELEASPLPVVLTLEDGTFAPEAGNIVASNT